MCNDVLRLRAQLGGDWVVTFGLPTRSPPDLKIYKYILYLFLYNAGVAEILFGINLEQQLWS